MTARQREHYVYELDTDSLVTDLMQALLDRGNTVIEQVPAGVWWFQTEREQADMVKEIVRTFEELLGRELRLVEQQEEDDS